MTLLFIQIFNGLVNGAFYALLSLGLAVIFGMLRIVNFAHGALYMLGAFTAYALGERFGLGFWTSVVIAPLSVGVFGMLLERTMIRRLYDLPASYNLLLTFGLTLVIQDGVRLIYGISGQPYAPPPQLSGATNLGFIVFPTFRLFAIVVSVVICLLTWFIIERTRVGAVIRACTENPTITRAFGIDVSLWVTAVFGFGSALAGLAGVLAAPIYSVDPLMGSELIITTFAVVVIGGLGSILGSVITGYAVGVLVAIGSALYPPIANTLIFILMAGLWGLAFTGFPYAIALKTGNPAAVNTSFILFFPFAFLTTSFLPLDSLSGWLQAIAKWNPVTYLLASMRSLLYGGWDFYDIGVGLLAIGIVGTVSMTLAFAALRGRLKRG